MDIEIPLPAAPVQPSAGAQSFSVTAAWFSDVSLFLDPWGGWPLCHHSAGHRETTEQVFLKEWMFLLGFTTAFYDRDGRSGLFSAKGRDLG